MSLGTIPYRLRRRILSGLQGLTSMAEHPTQARARFLLIGDIERKTHTWLPLDEGAHFCVDAERYG